MIHKKGWDLTFSAPKSVSILGLSGKDSRLIEAHNNAVRTTLYYLESELVSTRKTIKGLTFRDPTKNITVAQFQHKTSRALDMQLHTHNLVMNITHDGEKWKSIESRNIYDNSRILGQIYQNELAKRVKDMGYGIAFDPKKGTFEIEDVPKDLIKQMSKRREDIEKAADKYGYRSARGMGDAAIRTRGRKQSIDDDVLQKKWQAEIKEFGFDPHSIIQRARGITPGNVGLIKQAVKGFFRGNTSLEAVRFAYKNMIYHEASIKKNELVLNTLKWTMGNVMVSQVYKALEILVEKGELVKRQVGNVDGFTSKDEIEKEQKIIKIMQEGKGRFKAIASGSFIEASLENQGLTPGHYASAKHILKSKDLVIGVQGYAGTGKTTMLEHVNNVILAAKSVFGDTTVRELGFAPTGVAAKELGGSGITSQTLASHLYPLQNRRNLSSYRNNIWFVDEASMVNSDAMKELLDHAKRLNSKVVLIGDVKQLSAIQSGKPYEQLIQHGMDYTVMKDIMRQKDSPRLLGAVKDSIENRVYGSFSKLKETLYENSNSEERITSLVDHYFSMGEDRENTLLLIPDNKTRNTVQDLIRERLKKEGKIDSKGHTFTAHISAQLTPHEMTKGQFYNPGMVIQFNRGYASLGVKKRETLEVIKVKGDMLFLKSAKGDEVRLLTRKIPFMNPKNLDVFEKVDRQVSVGNAIGIKRTDKDKGLLNGDKGKVISINQNEVTLSTENGFQKTIDFKEFKTWEHGYASTVYSAQGATTKNVIALIESWRRNLVTSRSFYVSISRAKENVFLYTDNKKKAIEGIQNRQGQKESALVDADGFMNYPAINKFENPLSKEKDMSLSR